MKLFQREPTLYLAVIYAAITVLGTAGLAGLSPQQAGLINAAVAGVVAAINAYTVRPISPVPFTYAIAGVANLLAAYGANIDTETMAAINGLVVPILALLTRSQVSPETTTLTTGSPPLPKVDATSV